MSIVGIPDIVEVNLNEDKIIEFKLFNSGQTNFTEPIYIRVNGISNEWYELSPPSVNFLGINQQKTISMKIKLTPELCGGKCPKYALVNIVAKSEEISKSVSFTLKVLGAENIQIKENETSESESSGGLSLNLPNVVGFVPKVGITNQSTNYLFLTIIVILLLLITTKKKRRGIRGGGGIREPVTEQLHKIK